MIYSSMTPGTFLARPNRFIAHVETEEGLQICHVKNTGRCRELLVPGATVWLEESDNPARKTRYDLVSVEKQTESGSICINMDSHRVLSKWLGDLAADQFETGSVSHMVPDTWCWEAGSAAWGDAATADARSLKNQSPVQTGLFLLPFYSIMVYDIIDIICINLLFS